TSDLLNNTSYTITVTTGVKDVAGNALAAPSTSTFTTIADTISPTIIATSPVNGATGVATSAVVTVTFSEDMDPTTVNGTTFTLKTTVGSIAVIGTVSYNTTTRIATFTPTAALTANTGYTATVTTGAKDLAGNPLAVNASFSFTTAP
ncbi:MAG TPA: Ig-like domain-containing protein, partial [Gemmatimonadaceae bacterium]|nr:Ig-like domain-containing protein [Gemmatimonadaceae bacterium]